jgi:hypothetical protein
MFNYSSNFREMDITKRRIDKILKAGATVVLTTGGIDDLCLKQFVEAGAMAVRRCLKPDLKRIAKASGGWFEFTQITFIPFDYFSNIGGFFGNFGR